MQMTTSAEPKCKTTVWILQRLGEPLKELDKQNPARSLPYGELLGAVRFLTPQIRMSGDLSMTHSFVFQSAR